MTSHPEPTKHHLVLEAIKQSPSGVLIYSRHGVMVVEQDPDAYNWVKASDYQDLEEKFNELKKDIGDHNERLLKIEKCLWTEPIVKSKNDSFFNKTGA